MKKLQKRKYQIVMAGSIALGLCLTGCSTTGLAQESTFESSFENTKEETVDIYVSQLTGIVKQVDTIDREITVRLLEKNEEQSFSYDTATTLTDQYGAPMVFEQLVPGSIVDLFYNSTLQKAGSLQIHPDIWNYTDIHKFSLNTNAGILTVGDQEYVLDADVFVFSENEEILPEQILQQDVISIQGIGEKVFSITVQQGHGYLELKNEEYFIDGWIEIGQTLISKISPEMLFSVPEGTYQVRLTSELLNESREVTIARDQITVLDLGDIEKPVPESGQVTLQITPEDAEVYIDDHLVNAYYTIKLPLGMHEITVSASGYDTVSQYFQVDGEPLTLEMSLSESKSTVSGNTVSWALDNQTQATITIEAPVGAEVYEDNLYKGYAPVTYTKTPGTHVITLRKTGYVTRSYTIEVQDDDENIRYAFPDLEPEGTTSGSSVSGNSLTDETKSTVSGNTVSGNTITDQSSENETVSGNSVSENSLN